MTDEQKTRLNNHIQWLEMQPWVSLAILIAQDIKDLMQELEKANERNEPKKIKHYESHPEDIYLCPVCGSTFVRRNGVQMNYCNNCGQALSEEVDE